MLTLEPMSQTSQPEQRVGGLPPRPHHHSSIPSSSQAIDAQQPDKSRPAAWQRWNCAPGALLATLLLSACPASTPQYQPGDPASDVASGIHCPAGTEATVGQTQGVLSAVWCQRPSGQKHGPFLDWWENRMKKSSGEYRDGVRTGVWTFYLQDGQPDTKVLYRDGEALPLVQSPTMSLP